VAFGRSGDVAAFVLISSLISVRWSVVFNKECIFSTNKLMILVDWLIYGAISRLRSGCDESVLLFHWRQFRCSFVIRPSAAEFHWQNACGHARCASVTVRSVLWSSFVYNLLCIRDVTPICSSILTFILILYDQLHHKVKVIVKIKVAPFFDSYMNYYLSVLNYWGLGTRPPFSFCRLSNSNRNVGTQTPHFHTLYHTIGAYRSHISLRIVLPVNVLHSDLRVIIYNCFCY